MTTATELIIGVSSCLLGLPVRYDGACKRDSVVADVLAPLFRLIPVCPEVGCGLPVPREPMRLEGDPDEPHLMTCQSRMDRTDLLLSHCSRILTDVHMAHMCGFIFKERSPSCGLSVQLFGEGGAVKQFASGLFAGELQLRFPEMPVVEAERLGDAVVLNAFIDQVRRFHCVASGGRS